MQQTLFINGQVLVVGRVSADHEVMIDGGTIVDVQPSASLDQADIRVVDLEGRYLLPGYIDTQVNGGGGVLFNDSPTVDGIRTIAEAHRQFGTTGMLPTLISDDLEVIQQGLKAVHDAIEAGVPGVLGIHIEGPFLSQDRRGVHDPGKLRQLTHDIITQLEPLTNGCSVLTVAPETVQPRMIQELADKGFIPCAGHSNASYEQILEATHEGVRGFTHLFNAMSQLGAREPGVVGAALDLDQTWCGVIADIHHVSPASLRIAYRMKGPEKLMLVTDAMPPVGSPDREFFLLGNRITVRDGVCLDGEGTLAGTALDMTSALKNIMQTTGCGLVDASMMASGSPAAFLGIGHRTGTITKGARADFIIADSELRVHSTIIGGREFWN
jgi:N-acetylglucosamine-6-phosphate deacetylase